MVRAKFVVDAITPNADGACISLHAVHSGSKENDVFFKWTPSGRIDIGTVNPAAVKQFEVGKEYYVDFSPATD